MTASIKVPPHYNLPLIAERAGNGGVDSRVYRDGVLFVEGVTQEALQQALDNYDDDSEGLGATEYARLRKAEYPDIGDQLDALWKHLNYRRMEGENLVQDADDILNRILAVKNKYQKPEST